MTVSRLILVLAVWVYEATPAYAQNIIPSTPSSQRPVIDELEINPHSEESSVKSKDEELELAGSTASLSVLLIVFLLLVAIHILLLHRNK